MFSIQWGGGGWSDGVGQFFACDSARAGSGRVCGFGFGGGIETPRVVVVEDGIYFFWDAGPGVGVHPPANTSGAPAAKSR